MRVDGQGRQPPLTEAGAKALEGQSLQAKLPTVLKRPWPHSLHTGLPGSSATRPGSHAMQAVVWLEALEYLPGAHLSHEV